MPGGGPPVGREESYNSVNGSVKDSQPSASQPSQAFQPLDVSTSFLPQLRASMNGREVDKPWEQLFLHTMEDWVARHEAALYELALQQQHLTELLRTKSSNLEDGSAVTPPTKSRRITVSRKSSTKSTGSRRFSFPKFPFMPPTPARSRTSSKLDRSIDTEDLYTDRSGGGDKSSSVRIAEPPAVRHDFQPPHRSMSDLFRGVDVPVPKRSTTRERMTSSERTRWDFVQSPSKRWMGGASTILSHVSESRPLKLTKRFQESVKKMVQSSAFDVFCAILIASNAILVGIETETMSFSSGDDVSHQDTGPVFFAQYFLNLWFIVELLFRIVAEGHHFLVSQDWRWNWFDTFLVATSILDIFTTSLDVGGLQMGRVFRAVRLFRIVRTLRIVRMLQYIREFRKMVFALMASIQTLVWSLLLLFFVIYTYGVWFTQGAAEVLRSDEVVGTDYERDLHDYYGSLGRSFYSLFMAIFNGKSWGLLMDPLLSTDGMMAVQFISFICISLLGVMNVVTAVFVDSAMLSTQHYKDLLVQEKMAAKETFVRHVKTIFRQIDKNGDGTISAVELQSYIDDEKLQLQTYFEALELNPSDTFALFKLMDPDNSGTIDIDEFCDGCMKLQGSARSFDLNCIMYEQRRQVRMVENFVKEFRGRFEHLMSHQEWLEKTLLKMPTTLSHAVQIPSTSRPKSLRLAAPLHGADDAGLAPRCPTPDFGKVSRTLPSLPPAWRGLSGSGAGNSAAAAALAR